MKTYNLREDIGLFFYYALLLAVYLSWGDPDNLPSASLRIAFFGATLIPVFFLRPSWLPAIIVLFNTLALNGYSSSYLPAQYYTYIVGILVGFFFLRVNKEERLSIPFCLILIASFSLLRNIIDSQTVEKITIFSFVTILLLIGIQKNDLYQRNIFEKAIVAITIVLTVGYFIYGRDHVSAIQGYDEERMGFADINYVACIIGFGVLIAFVRVFSDKELTLVSRLLYIGIIGLCILSLFLNASRGSVLALALGMAIVISRVKVSVWWRVLFVVLIAVFIVFLYNNSYMDVLFYRVYNDELGGGGGRMAIWQSKWKDFVQADNIIEILFGTGYRGGRSLGLSSGEVAFHNDFLAFLMEYGVVGLVIFLSFFFWPLYKSSKEMRNRVLAYTGYLLITCLTLEPFAAGRLPYYAFWLYIYWTAQSKPNFNV